jgi:hypothetical protein
MLNIIFLSDFFSNEIQGGAEFSDEALIEELSLEFNIEKIKCSNFQRWSQNKDLKQYYFIISNFIHLDSVSIEQFIANKNYIIYEHDHKYLKTRNPSNFTNFVAPIGQIQFDIFYKNALAVFGQTHLHCQVIKNNLNIDNIINVGGSLWTKDQFITIKSNIVNVKNKNFGIINDPNPIKGTMDSINYAKKNKISYELIEKSNFNEFINKISKFNNIIFLPKTLETCSRVVLEARMLGVSIMTHNLTGALSESWFKTLKNKDLIEFLEKKPAEVASNIKNIFLNNKSVSYFKGKDYIKDRVSIVVPSYNDSKYLDSFFDDILNQTYNNLEIIFVNDCSTDNTREIILKKKEELNKKGILFSYFETSQNGGTGAALNLGFKYISGEYSTWWSTDDKKYPNCIEDLVSVLKKEQDVEHVIASYHSERFNLNWRSVFCHQNKWNLNYSGFFDGSIEFTNNYHIFSSKEWVELNSQRCHSGVSYLWKSTLKDACGEFLCIPGEDYVMTFMMGIKAKKTAYLDKILGVHKFPMDSITSQKPLAVLTADSKVRQLYTEWKMNKVFK